MTAGEYLNAEILNLEEEARALDMVAQKLEKELRNAMREGILGNHFFKPSNAPTFSQTTCVGYIPQQLKVIRPQAPGYHIIVSVWLHD